MSSQTTLKLPIIRLSSKNLKPETSSWLLVQDQVRKALEEYGCFEAVYDDVTLELHKAVFRALEDLFQLPLETKRLNTYENPYYGYIGQRAQIPLYESLGIEQPLHLEQVQSFTDLMWPEGNTSFCEIMHAFTTQMADLEQMVKRMIFGSYGLEKYFNSFSEPDFLLRLMKYEGPNNSEAALGIDIHTDKSCITILHQNQVKGLEVLTKDDEWISYIPSADSFVVMLGEALMAWSNGRLQSPHHRVMMSGNDARYSTALFSFGRDIIQTPEELVDEEHPLQFKPFDPRGLVRFFYTEEGRKARCTVKAYCGV